MLLSQVILDESLITFTCKIIYDLLFQMLPTVFDFLFSLSSHYFSPAFYYCLRSWPKILPRLLFSVSWKPSKSLIMFLNVLLFSISLDMSHFCWICLHVWSIDYSFCCWNMYMKICLVSLLSSILFTCTKILTCLPIPSEIFGIFW